MLMLRWAVEKWWNGVSLRLFGPSRRQLHWINMTIRAELDRACDDKAVQMARADRAELDLSQARHDLAVASNDVQALNARAREDARRIAVAAELLDDEREACEELRSQNVALKAELATLRTIIGNARNQLDGRAHHTSIEIAECCGA